MVGGKLAALSAAVFEPAGFPPPPPPPLTLPSPPVGGEGSKRKRGSRFRKDPLAPHRGERGSGQGGKPAEAEKP